MFRPGETGGMVTGGLHGPPKVAEQSISSDTKPKSTQQKDSLLKNEKITYGELMRALDDLRSELAKNIGSVADKANQTAENAAKTAKALAGQLQGVLDIENRVSTMKSLVQDYSEQLHGFDSGLATQIQGFQDQMDQMRHDLTAGLMQLSAVNTNVETAAVMELNEHYEALVSELDSTLYLHSGLTAYQRQLSDELRSLVECVEMMREEKADRDEILDGLKDKADNSRLIGLLTEKQFEEARKDLETR
ncbi:uncharacterized protein LOC113239254 [Hyposmocoma kahamanoa]|uniref:uncharacterized protein LOC113239254 n=1 Tax=Hyposmocoma kahamanoa TaxID=1477025 RepID=UPI000E6D7566|nr:uncharacterized protein LOC113239254 [Hyposmocoma kahamanoa]